MQLEIITPDKTVFEGEVESATFPGSKGTFQVMKNHAAIISSLEKGKVVYVSDRKKHEITVNGGIVEVVKNRIVLLAEKILGA